MTGRYSTVTSRLRDIVAIREEAVRLTREIIHVWCADLKPGTIRLRQLHDILSSEERGRAGQFRHPRDRNRFVAARGQLRILLSVYGNRPPDRLVFSYGELGKPALLRRAGEPDLRFNLSHGGRFAVYAVTLGREVGVDIERVRSITDQAAILDRWFTPEEQRKFHGLEPDERDRVFFQLWTRKEALLKALGIGLSGLAQQISVTGADDSGLLEIRPSSFPGQAEPAVRPRHWTLQSFTPEPDHVAAVAVAGRDHRLEWWHWDGSPGPS